MAKLDTTGLDAVVDELRRLGEGAGDVCERMIDAGAEEVRKAWRNVAEARGHRDTGAMIESIDTAAPDKRNPNALYREIYPQGKDSKGVRNAEKAYILHYGTTHIRADYWVDEAEAQAEGPAMAAMLAIWDDFLAKRT